MWTDVPLVLIADEGGSAGFQGDSSGGSSGTNDTAGDSSQSAGDGGEKTLQNADSNDAAPADPGLFGGNFFLILMLVLGGVLILSMFSSRKEKKKRKELLASVGKGDKVQTIGGILGTVMDVKGDEVVLKVDETTNARMRFARSAVQNILQSKNAKPEADADKDKDDAKDEDK